RAGLAKDLTVERIFAYPHEAHPPPQPKRKNNLGEPQQTRPTTSPAMSPALEPGPETDECLVRSGPSQFQRPRFVPGVTCNHNVTIQPAAARTAPTTSAAARTATNHRRHLLTERSVPDPAPGRLRLHRTDRPLPQHRPRYACDRTCDDGCHTSSRGENN